MRLDKIWTVASKDIAEFRTNRYIMFSLILMPLIMSVFLPVLYIFPIAVLGDDSPTQPYDLELDPQQLIENQELADLTISQARLEGCNITNAVLVECEIERCLLNQTVVRSSFVGNSSSLKSVIIGSNLLNVNLVRVNLMESVQIGEPSDKVQMLETFIDGLLIFFVMIPAILPTLIASYSIVGEKLNKSLEPLLATPTTDLELLMGKGFSIFLPTMLVTWISLVPFVVIVDVISQPVLGYYPLPDLTWALGVFLLAPLFCLLSIFANVIVSSRVSDVRASQQIGSLVVLPVVALFIVVIAGLVTLSLISMLVFIGLIALLVAGILYSAVRVFRREEILVRWK